MNMKLKRFGLSFTGLALIPFLVGLLVAAPAPANAQKLKDIKVGVVNIREAVVKSSAGERIKNILVASKNQKESELKGKEESLKQQREALKNNIMLTDQARKSKEAELRKMESDFRKEVRAAQRELQQRERKMTESTIIELKTVIETFAKEEKFDLVVEESFSQVILYAGAKFEDITEKVIQRYNRIQTGQ